MKRMLAVIALAAISASQSFGLTDLITPGYAGNVVFSLTIGRAHGGESARFAVGGPDTDVSSPGFDQVEKTITGAPSDLAGDAGVKGDFFAVFALDDILGSGGSKLDIPAGKTVAGMFFGLEDNEVTPGGGGEIFLESTGGRVEFYLIDTPAGMVFDSGLGGADWSSGSLVYSGINDVGTPHEALFAINLKSGELSASDEPGFGGTFNPESTEIRSLNTTPGGAAGNNGAFYASIDKTFGNTTLAHRLDNGGFGLTNGADFEGDYTMNLNFLEDPFAPGNFSLEFNDPLRASVTAIPEPSTILLLGTGLMGLVAYRRRNAA